MLTYANTSTMGEQQAIAEGRYSFTCEDAELGLGSSKRLDLWTGLLPGSFANLSNDESK